MKVITVIKTSLKFDIITDNIIIYYKFNSEVVKSK